MIDQAVCSDSASAGVMMLRDIAELFATRPGQPDWIASSELVTDLIMMEDRP
ncbi:hypothetical protein [Roseovarius pacificus]|uniref:hypothetical protein n=1 Tax=Roseovarius pacificus TaxID=337701 RepID=UPI002A18A311|nr:hypothetical protein [Roseovarius pacificus]